MGAVTVATPPVPAEPEQAHDGEAEATRSTEELFQWSGYVHYGTAADGVYAEDCEQRLDGSCKDPRHFHAWVCLPNPYQIRDIADKARAARARKSRALHDAGRPDHPDPKRREPSDSYVILESELDELRRPPRYGQLIDAIARRNIESSLVEIIDDLNKDERFENHAQDSEEFRRLQAIDEDKRDAEEFERLTADMLSYGEEMQKAIDERVANEAEHLRGKPVDDVIDIERQFRIEDISSEAYLHTYYTWAIYTGTRQPSTEGFPSVRKFADPAAQTNAAPEVIVALREKLRVLEQRTVKRGDAAGN